MRMEPTTGAPPRQVRLRSQSAQDNANKIRAHPIDRRVQSELRRLDAIPNTDPRELKILEEALMPKPAKKALKSKVENDAEVVHVPPKSKRPCAAKHVEPETIPQFQPPARAKSEDKAIAPVFTKLKTCCSNTR